jgi:hypothetical protein
LPTRSMLARVDDRDRVSALAGHEHPVPIARDTDAFWLETGLGAQITLPQSCLSPSAAAGREYAFARPPRSANGGRGSQATFGH